jgi:hypothetical protein
MRPDSDEYYCYQWCGRLRWACVRDATGRDFNWVLVLSSGRIVPVRAGSWELGEISTLRIAIKKYWSSTSIVRCNNLPSCTIPGR